MVLGSLGQGRGILRLLPKGWTKGLATKGWMDRFPFSKKDHIVMVSSDHLLILFSINSQ